MAVVKVKKKKVPSAKLPSEMNQAPLVGATPSFMGGNLVGAATGPMGGSIPTASTGPIGGPIPSANIMGAQPVPKAEGMSQQIDAMEMRNQGAPAAVPAPMPKAKVKTKKKAAMPSEPLSPQTWANIGNNPADYPAYLAAWKKQSGKK